MILAVDSLQTKLPYANKNVKMFGLCYFMKYQIGYFYNYEIEDTWCTSVIWLKTANVLFISINTITLYNHASYVSSQNVVYSTLLSILDLILTWYLKRYLNKQSCYIKQHW